jgi:gliding motility-associated-like protein
MQSGSLKAQVINNNGAAISVSGGTFVQGDTLENTAGSILNNGTIGLRGHYINIGTTGGNGVYNLQGNWINTGIFNAGFSSVYFLGNKNQIITSAGGEQFYNLTINNLGGTSATNRIILSNNADVAGILSIAQGNIETGANTLFLTNQSAASLNYTSVTGSRVIGKFERGINAAENYLFPIGSDANYNPLNLNTNSIQIAGSVLSEFVVADPGDVGLPIPDAGFPLAKDSVEVYEAFDDGYWSLTSNNGFSSNDYNINLDGSGFLSPLQEITRIIKRPSGGDWLVDGSHNNTIGSIAYRNNFSGGISNTGNHFGFGHCRPRIQVQPKDTAVCDGESAEFSVVASGPQPLTYQWQEFRGVGWNNISDGGIYSGTTSDTLLIDPTDLSMNGYRYRVFIYDQYGNFKISQSSATLTVNPNPVATATPQQDTICNGATTHIELTSDVPGTTFTLEVLYNGGILGTSTTLDGDTIKQTLTNPTLVADSVVYRIFPTGPFSTFCGGTADTVIIWVEPTVEINAVNDTICNTDFTNILVTSPNTTTNGIRYTWSVVQDANITGATNSIGQGQNINTAIIQSLTNSGLVAQKATYTITPWAVNAININECTDAGEVITIDIWVEPTIQINAASDTLCDGDNTNIVVTSPNTTTNGIRYTWTVADNPNINGETNSVTTGQLIGSAIAQTLINTSDSKQLVQFVITPWSINAIDENECTDASEIITINIWIDPTPRVIVDVIRDTICNDTYTQIDLTTPSVLTTGIVTFDYNSNPDLGITGNSTGITGLIDGNSIIDSLHNATAWPATPLLVRYSITPKGTAIGCADGTIITDSITVHPTADTKFVDVDSVTCYLDSDGTATIEARNTINNFTFLWNDPLNQTDSIADGLVRGEYIITVTDNQGCIKLDTVLIEEPDELFAGLDSLSDLSCFGMGDGYVEVDPIGGNGKYTYVWSLGGVEIATTPFIASVSGGDYDVTVYDYKFCRKDTSFTVVEPNQPNINIDVNNVRCYGENDGWVEVTTPAISYEWDTGETTSRIENLTAGEYTVTITTGDNCKASSGAEIIEPDSITVDHNKTNIICAGDASGTIDLTVIGGNDFFAYTYNWTTVGGSGLVVTDEDQTGISGGKYYVTVSDYRGCTGTDSAEIEEPGPFYLNPDSSNVTCFGDSNGWISLDVFGGNGNDYTYVWSNLNGDSFGDVSLIENLQADEYYVIVRDTASCEIFDTILITEPELLEIKPFETNSTCYGYNNGTIKIDITGGNGGYNINWSNGENTDSIHNLASGTYYVTVVDAENCTASDTIDINEPEEIIPNITSNNITCFGFNNGIIEANPSGGISPYNYIWSHDPLLTINEALDLDPGNYLVTVVDGNNCEDITSIDLTQPDPLEATVTKQDITCYSFGDGYISLSIFGGTPDYSYLWSNGVTEPNAQMLTEGNYNIKVTDINNCGIDTTIEIIEPEKLIVTPVIRRPTCPDIQDGYIELNLVGGIQPYQIYWGDGNPEENLYDIRSGIYDLYINDVNLCEIDTSFTVRSIRDFCINIPTVVTPNGDSFNEKWEINMGGLYPNVEIEIFNRWGKRVFYSKGYEESQFWDGTENGKELPMDSYYYIINLKNGAERLSGIVTIIR